MARTEHALDATPIRKRRPYVCGRASAKLHRKYHIRTRSRQLDRGKFGSGAKTEALSPRSPLLSAQSMVTTSVFSSRIVFQVGMGIHRPPDPSFPPCRKPRTRELAATNEGLARNHNSPRFHPEKRTTFLPPPSPPFLSHWPLSPPVESRLVHPPTNISSHELNSKKVACT
jgi:hypothetical protein